MNAGKVPAAAGSLMPAMTVFLASAAGLLRAGRRAVSAGGVGDRSRSQLTVLLLGDSLLLCASDELSRGKRSSD
jgi:hypothetical protein